MTATMKMMFGFFAPLLLCASLSLCWGQIPHWTNVSDPPYLHPKTPSTGSLIRWANNTGCGSGFAIESVDGESYAFAGNNAHLSIVKRWTHNGPSHSPIRALASGSCNVHINASTSGTATDAGSASSSVSSGGAFAGFGQGATPCSLSLSGSCSAGTSGQVSIFKTGLAASHSSTPPGTFAASDTHSAAFAIDDYVVNSPTVTMSIAASATTTASTASGTYWVLFSGEAKATGSAEVTVSNVSLEVGPCY